MASNHAVTVVTSGPGQIPSYCHGWVPHPITAAQWKQCWQLGWNQTTTGAAHAGHTAGSPVLGGLIVVALVVLFVSFLAGQSRRTSIA